MARNLLDPADLRKLIAYDADTGALVWKQRSEEWFSDIGSCRRWNTRRSGKPALNGLSKLGYLVGAVDDRKLMAHRVAWAIFYGEWPRREIDHINGVTTDNRISNLRDVSSSINKRNVKKSSRNSSGVNGVYFNQEKKKWMAYITTGGPKKNLGFFFCRTAAEMARKRAERGLGFTDRHGR